AAHGLHQARPVLRDFHEGARPADDIVAVVVLQGQAAPGGGDAAALAADGQRVDDDALGEGLVSGGVDGAAADVGAVAGDVDDLPFGGHRRAVEETHGEVDAVGD